MDEATERVRRVIRERLAVFTEEVKARLAAIVADPPEPEWGALAFEIDPMFWMITDNHQDEILSSEQAWAFVDSRPIRAEADVHDEDFNYDEVLSEEGLNWLADCWDEVGGNNVPYRAEAFFHGYHLDRFDLRNRCWNHLV